MIGEDLRKLLLVCGLRSWAIVRQKVIRAASTVLLACSV